MPWWADVLLALGTGLAMTWLTLAALLLRVGRGRQELRQAARLLPDLLRLLARLARDNSLPPCPPAVVAVAGLPCLAVRHHP